tara:strand:- start:273 stop:2036 length:1764 start_codon:yes stop_codon:yes gene_type:complete
MKRPIMGVANILDLQNNGYKSTVSAISEIIDNSIQANASKVDVYIVRNTTRKSNEIDEIIIVDNGSGMNKEQFDKALQMSNGTRTKASSGLGRYGMGLPNSSISQTKRVEVYTRNKSLLYNHIDLDEIFSSGEPFLSDVETRDLIDIPLFNKLKINPLKNTGTVVRWLKPNKLSLRTAKRLSENIEKLAGRIFRYFIKGHKENDTTYKSKISVFVYDYNGENFSIDNKCTKENILPFDPMFLMKDTQMDLKFTESEHPTSQLHEQPFSKEFQLTNSNGNIEKGKITIAISYCKMSERERYGRNAGGTDFGDSYLKRNLMVGSYNNISIVRAGREIDAGSFGYIGDVSNNRERWWSAEISFPPIFDDILGVDNKKQHASQIRFLDSEQLDSQDVHEVIKWIHKWLSGNLDTVKKIVDTQMVKSTTNKLSKENNVLPGSVTEEGSKVKDPETNNSKIKDEFFAWIKKRFKELEDKKINSIIEYALKVRDNHIFIPQDLGDTYLYNYTVIGSKVLIEINFQHAYYKHFIKKFEEANDETSKRAAYLLIGSLVNSEIENKSDNEMINRDRRKIRNNMATTLDDYIHDLYNN